MKKNILALALVGCLASCARAELVAHYPFDTGFDDVSGLENNGTAQGGASLGTDVPLGGGQSLVLADGQYVLVPHSDSLDITETMTVAAWVKPMGNAWEGLLAKNPSDGSTDNHAGNYEIRVETGSNQLHFLYQQGGDNDTAFPISDTPLAVISPDKWTHIVVTVEQIGDEPGEVKYYTNGVFADAKPINVGFGATNTNPLYIGSRADLFTQWNGYIDDLRIYNTVLSESEIGALTEGFGAFPVAGAGLIGNVAVSALVDQNSLQFGPEETGPGLVQEWYSVGNPGDKAGVDDIFANNLPVVPAFRSAGGSWWNGSASGAVPGVQDYPPEVQPQLTDQYTVRSTGEILIESSGPFTFLDGVDDFTYLAIDTNKNGVAGDTEEEILINDNTWTNPLRDANGGGGGWAEVDITVAEGGEWLALEFNMAEGGGGDHGMGYWDYDPGAPEGQRHQGILVPFADQAFFSAEEAALAVIPDTHLRGTTAPIIGGDAAGSIPFSAAGWAFEVNGDDDTADAFVLDPPLEALSTTLDVDGVQFEILPQGTINEGDSFQIIVADNISGTPNILTDGWTWDGSTGSVIFGSGGPMIPGDADGDGDVDTADRTIQTTNWTGALPPGDPGATKTKGEGDADGDGDVDTADANLAITNWTGAQQGPAGNLEDGDDANLVYDPASGNVTLDASDTASGVFISFVMATGQNNMMPDNLSKSADGSAGPFFDVGTNTDATTFQIGQTDPLNQGAGPEIDLGDIFPAGMDLAGLSEYLTLADYASALGQGGTLDLIVVPEPSSIALLLLGAMGLVARRRRK